MIAEGGWFLLGYLLLAFRTDKSRWARELHHLGVLVIVISLAAHTGLVWIPDWFPTIFREGWWTP